VVCIGSTLNKGRLLELLGGLLASGQAALTARQITDSLSKRERLGSTGLGRGIALPHGRLGQGSRVTGAFIRLKQGVDFDAFDRQPVDLVFGLLVPEQFTDEHLKILAYLAEMFSDQAFCQQLRQADTDQALLERLSQWQPPVLT
jgi:PTS system nitrogen regulatory IIA component